MMTMTELVSWFQLEYPALVKCMKRADHHLTPADCGEMLLLELNSNLHPSINPYHCEGDVFTHTMMVCKQAENAPYEVQIAALLHDIGKPATRAVNPKNGRVSFFNHDAVSAFMALEILKREELGLSKSAIIRIFNTIALHTQVFKQTPEQLARTVQLQPMMKKMLLKLGEADHNGRFYSIPSETHLGPLPTLEHREPKEFEKEVIIMCGLPNGGKSTWVNQQLITRDCKTIISRDRIITELEPDLPYNEAWKKVDQKKVDTILREDFKAATSDFKVIIDMTHMSKKSRKRSLSYFGPEFKKKCVMFLPDLPTIFERNKKREGKVLDNKIIENMMRSYYPPTYSEFDEIEYII